MLNKPVDEILCENGTAKGITPGEEKAYAPVIIGDRSYFAGMNGKVKVVGFIVRAICLLNHAQTS
jgi:RAB protein geranylgeranyltransferase component A